MLTKMVSRVAPIMPSEWGAAEHDAMGSAPAARDFVLGNWRTDPRGVHGVGVMLRNPAATKAFLTFNNHVSSVSSISKRVRELLILRLSWLRRSEYEFMQHVVLGRRFGLTDTEIERLQRGPDEPGWSTVDAALLRAVDELHADACIGDETWIRLSVTFTVEQIIDVIYTVGCYEIAAMIFKTLGAIPEHSAEPMSPETRARMHGAGM